MTRIQTVVDAIQTTMFS